MSKSYKTSGLDQLGPRHWEGERDLLLLFSRPRVVGTNARAELSMRTRKVKVTLSDHLFSSDEIKTREDGDEKS